jgi:hypothetical protein
MQWGLLKLINDGNYSMSKELVIVNEKQIVSGIAKAISKMESAKKGYVNSVIELGETLIQAKIKAGHGNWNLFLNRNSELRFGSTEQARKIMLIAENKAIVLEFFNNENSINGLTNAINEATPEQIAQVEQIKKEEADRIALAETNKALAEAKAAIDNAKKQDDVIDGVFEEVKQSAPVVEILPEDEFDEIEELRDLLDEQHSANKALQDDNDSLVKIHEANEPLAVAMEELKKSNALNRILNERINGLMNEKNEAIRNAKMWKGQFERLEKSRKAA